MISKYKVYIGRELLDRHYFHWVGADYNSPKNSLYHHGGYCHLALQVMARDILRGADGRFLELVFPPFDFKPKQFPTGEMFEWTNTQMQNTERPTDEEIRELQIALGMNR